MKRTLIFTALTGLLASSANAATILGISAGGGVWQNEFKGSLGKPSVSVETLGVTEQDNEYFYLLLEHPVPFIPNIKVQRNELSSIQQGTLDSDFRVNKKVFAANSTVQTDIDLSHTDATLYYELLDNWISADVGVTLRKFDGVLSALDLDTQELDHIDVDQTLPLIYAKAQFDLPFSGLSAAVEANVLSYDGNNISDYSAKLSYTFDGALDASIDLGLKGMQLKLKEDGVHTNLETSGPFIAARLTF